MNSVKIAGLEILAVKDRDQLADFLINQTSQKTGMLVAINAEKVVLAKEKRDLAQLFTTATYKYADGVGVLWAMKQKAPQYRHIERVPGIDLWETLMWRAITYGIPVFLLGADEAVVSETAKKWRLRGANIVGQNNGYFENDEEMISLIRKSGAKFVSVAMGSPKQEKFMHNALMHYPNCLYMGVGGSYDVFVGKVKRAPQIWQKLGLEWFYRFLKQPTRWERQIRVLKYAYYYATKQLN